MRPAFLIIIAMLTGCMENQTSKTTRQRAVDCRLLIDVRSNVTEARIKWHLTRCIAVGPEAFAAAMDRNEFPDVPVNEVAARTASLLACRAKIRSINSVRATEPVFRGIPGFKVTEKLVKVSGKVEVGGSNGVFRPHDYLCYVKNGKVTRHKITVSKPDAKS